MIRLTRFSRTSPLDIHCQSRAVAVPRKRLIELADRLFHDTRLSRKQRISLVFCADAAIRRLNTHYRHIDRATDVLSFSIGDPDILGEIYISLPRVRVQAKRYGVTCSNEIIRLFVHGFFHLIGFDHGTEAQRRAMEARERPYLP